jgi:hypothetical protein
LGENLWKTPGNLWKTFGQSVENYRSTFFKDKKSRLAQVPVGRLIFTNQTVAKIGIYHYTHTLKPAHLGSLRTASLAGQIPTIWIS